ncbi:Peptidoglycan O-acetyltransferase [Acaryochloris thomasi RCC1774]|uniref:Peptidoglycan O-acetyltransferase n=1 Tax=Acaryochloris thomasi RCC1774 TaxID=1764569 RepID=A0A2W1JI32_9CYAN|nr:MBOAT family O-acyltransferase [Acaryochloris thomasi]PZD73180.1 Peptidoglycan O-acetyltransferase [Acaryochloris thomasi RCC1774]
MIFTEFKFLFFFAAVFCVNWLLRKFVFRKIFLLICSYLFYAAWDWRFLSLIWMSTIVDYILGLQMKSAPDVSRKRFLLSISLVVNLGVLGFFKYFNFFLESAFDLLAWLDLPTSTNSLEIILPVGISFYTFQTLSYTIDVYRGHLEPTRSPIDFALFVAFFPQLVAGPIVRASDFIPQLSKARSFVTVPVRACLVLFLFGFFKKACIADSIAPAVDAVYSQPSEYSAFSIWQAIWLYAIQIYCDFSGYTDMAIACAGLLGFSFPDNFNYPYFASNISDFWRRWHISLSTWLKDYLYIPLGGNRGSRGGSYRNLMITMVLGGLWHGAAWRFIAWGAMHGGALIGHKVYLKQQSSHRRDLDKQEKFIVSLLGTLLTFTWVCLAWVFFRADGLDDAMSVIFNCFSFGAESKATLGFEYIPLLIGLLLTHWLSYRGYLERAFSSLPGWGFSLVYGAAYAVVFAAKPTNYEPFIYFQF